METRFGKFITGKYFPKIFWTFYILLTLFLAAVVSNTTYFF